MKAMMSDSHGKPASAGTINEYSALLTWQHEHGNLVTLSADRAVAEAQRVLAETEGERLAVHVALGSSAMHARHSAETPVGLGTILAESLSAVLPVLDELAVDAIRENTETDWRPCGDLWAMSVRNRATDATLDACAELAASGPAPRCGCGRAFKVAPFLGSAGYSHPDAECADPVRFNGAPDAALDGR